MASLRNKSQFFLTAFTVGICAALFLSRSAPRPEASKTNVSTEELPSNAAVATVVGGPQVMVDSSSVQAPSKRQPISTSVHQILPQLEQTVTDWRSYQPQKLTIAPYADLAMEFEMNSVRQEAGRTIWTGRNVLNGAFLVAVAMQNEWHAVMEVPAASSFEFHISGQAATVTETDQTVLCGDGHLVASAAVAGNTVEIADIPANEEEAELERHMHTVDVLFFYDAATLSANGSNAQKIETSIVSMVEAANRVLENSKIENFRWRFVAAYQVPDYAATSKLKDDLLQITLTDSAVGQFVAKKTELHGVDQTVLFVNEKRADGNNGLAWTPGAGSIAHHAVVVWNSGYVVLAHELAHNFGCRHDRQQEKAIGADGYGYGFRFELNGRDTGTVMSYAKDDRVPFFSNPDVEYVGVCLGVSEDQGEVANNSRVLRENASLMAGCRDATLAPVITAQPQPTKVARGAGFSLSVTAVGDELAYQWRKNGVAVSGATDPVFSKAIAGSGDVGIYDVVVSNAVGETLSAAASVAVEEPIASADAASSTNSGSQGSSAAGAGGGGGAVEPWVLVAFALLGTLRLIGRARRKAA